MNGNNQAFNVDAGLTIREYIATQAMVGLLANAFNQAANELNAALTASHAVTLADALIAALSK